MRKRWCITLLSVLTIMFMGLGVSAQAATGGTLQVATPYTVVTLDWHTSTDSSLRYLGWHIYEGLVCFGKGFEPIPQLAESWDISQDGREYTFKLRKGVMFHKGYGEMKASDVKASLDRMFQKGIRSNDFRMVSEVKIVDDYTVKLVLSESSYLLLPLLSTPLCFAAIIPEELAKVEPRKLTNEQIVGTGPFELGSYTPGEKLVLKKFDKYTPNKSFKGPEGMGGMRTAYFDQVQINFVTDANTRMAGLTTGKYDYIISPPQSEFEEIDNNKGLSWFKTTLIKNTWNFNTNRKPTNSTAVRRAMLIASNMEEIMYAQMQGQKEFYRLDSSFFGKGGPWWYPAGEICGVYGNNPNVEEAKRLLKLGGYNGEEVILLCTASTGPGALVMAEHLKAIGMKVKVGQYDWATAVSRRESGNWSIFMGGATQSQFDPSSMRLFYYGPTSKKLWGYQNPMMDAMVDASAKIGTTEDRIKAVQSMQEFLWTNLPCFTAGDWFRWSAYKSELSGPTLDFWYMDRFWNVERK